MPASPNIARRTVIGTAICLTAAPGAALARKTNKLIAGTYAGRRGPGLVPLVSGPKDWTASAPLAAIKNVSFGVQASASGVRYLLDEQQKGALGIYGRDMRQLGVFSTLGADPCHAALSPDARTLAVANYSSGSVALWRLDPKTGLPTGEAQRIEHRGSGPNAKRQAAPHAHWVGFAANGRVLYAVDLGADAIFAHAIDPRTGSVGATSIAYRAQAGSGPRHLADHPRLPVAYLVAELTNTVTILTAHRDGTFTAQGSLSTLPAGFDGSSYVAHIAINRAGTRLYVSNRGHDSIAVFAIGRTGALQLIQHVACGGHWPRLFLLLEDRGEMLVANERSGNVAILRLGTDGRLGSAKRGPSVPGVAFLSR
ncbi:lactonase family protein [Sphingomonas sp. LT1P40]|uniref:lactonase family protein n=1 Tax=Alteristakelama amylovorans TaxID=3096166 RepID=UPI002FCBA53D